MIPEYTGDLFFAQKWFIFHLMVEAPGMRIPKNNRPKKKGEVNREILSLDTCCFSGAGMPAAG